jgi:hypothetical protein
MCTEFNFDEDYFFNQFQNKIKEVTSEYITDLERERYLHFSPERTMLNGTICNTKNGDIDDLENEKIDYDLETSLPDGSEESDDTSGIFSLDVSDNEQKYKF